MSYSYEPPATALGSTAKAREFRRLADAVEAAGFDLADGDTDWVLQISDIHFLKRGDETTQFIDESVKTELLALAVNPPNCIVANGDFLTEYSPTVGYGPWPAGTQEFAWANVEMPTVAALATLRCTTGNHDSAPNLEPVEQYMNDNCPWYSGGVQAWKCGGVWCITIPLGHDARVGDQAAYNAAMAAVDDDAEVMQFFHQPALSARVTESRLGEGFMEALPAEMTNDITCLCGHAHDIYTQTFSVKATTVSQVRISAASSDAHSSDSTNPCLGAVIMKAGKVDLILTWNGNTGMWTPMPTVSRTSPPTMPRRDDGVPAPSLVEYWEGDYDRTEIMLSTANTAGTFRDVGGWIAEIATVNLKFPNPATATRFWVCSQGTHTIELSDDNVTFETVTQSSRVQDIITMSIPAAMQGSDFLWVRVTGGSAINGWGFSS